MVLPSDSDESHLSPSLPPARGGGARAFRVAVTRSLPGSAAPDRLSELLVRAGMEPVSYPLTRTVPPVEGGALRRAARAWAEGGADVLLFTSPRAVRAFREVLDAEEPRTTEPIVGDHGSRAHQTDQRDPTDREIWVVGPATAEAAKAAGFPPTRMPARFVAEGLVEALPSWGPLAGKRVLFPRAAEGRDLVLDALVGEGAHVVLVEAYRTLPNPDMGSELWRAILSGRVDALALTASSQVRVLAASRPSEAHLSGERPTPWPEACQLVALGPATRILAQSLGLPVHAQADPHTLEVLVTVLEQIDAARGTVCDSRISSPSGPTKGQ